jgi:hypothetical protein
VSDDDPDGISWRFLAALAAAKLGHVDVALAEFHQLRPAATALLGAEHPQVRAVQEQIEFWSGR